MFRDGVTMVTIFSGIDTGTIIIVSTVTIVTLQMKSDFATVTNSAACIGNVIIVQQLFGVAVQLLENDAATSICNHSAPPR